jgi:SET domain-containing protein
MFTQKEELEKFFNITYLQSLRFESVKVEAKIKKRCEKKLSKINYNKENKWTRSLFEDSLLKHKEAPYLIKKVNPLIGYGVFAAKSIADLEFIGEYTGLVRKRKFFGESSNDYVFGYVAGPDDTPWVIDAREYGNFTRFINHSYSPNLTSRWIISGGVGHIIFFANRLILPGEQLTYDYGPYYWRKRSYPQDV